MRFFGRVLFCSCLFVILFPTDNMAQQPGERIPGQYVVIFRSDLPAPAAAAQEMSRAHGFSVRHVYQYALRGMAIQLPGDARAQSRILVALQRDPRVRAVGQDMYAGLFQTVPKGVRRIFGDPGGNPKPINAGTGIFVAILDTGLDFNHPDLAANIDVGMSRTCMSSATLGCRPGGQDDNGHGTFVGGNVAAINNSIDVVGPAHQTKLIGVKVLNSSGSGSFADITAAVDYLTGVRQSGTALGVANMSLGARCSVCTDGSTDPTVQAFQTAVRGLVNAGTAVIVAAGNDGVDASTTIPASFSEVITVSALADTDGQPGGQGPSIIIPGLGKFNDDTFAKFSNYGAPIDIIAPGVNELSLRLGGGTRTSSGTSFSSPYAASVAAIFIRHHLNSAGTWPGPALVRSALIETGECANGGGTVFHNGAGCSQKWPGDPDNLPEPLVRADRVHLFSSSSAPVIDVAVTSLTVASEVVVNTTQPVDVGVKNNGTQSQTFTVTLSTSPASSVSGPQNVTLAAGASTTVNFTWTPGATGSYTVTGAVSGVSGDSNSANDSMSQSVTVVAEPPPPSADPAISSITPNSMSRNTTIPVQIVGANFAAGATVSFEGSGPLPSASSVTVSADGTTINCDVTSKSGGGPTARTYDVVVRNPDGKSARLSGGFTVTP